MKRSLYLLIIAILVLLVISCDSTNQDDLVNISEESLESEDALEVIKIGVMTDYSPYIIVSDDTVEGPYIKLIETLMEQLNYEYELISLPWSRLIGEIENGDIDFAFPFFDKVERHAFMDYEEIPLGFSQISLIGLEGLDLDYDGDLSQLNAYTIGVVQDYFYSSDFAEASAEGLIQTEAAISTSQNIEKLLQGRVDLIVEDPEVVREYVKKQGISQSLVYLTEPITIDYNHLVFTKVKDLSLLRHAIHETMEDLKDQGTLFSLYEAYDMAAYGQAFRDLLEENPPPVRFIQDTSNTPLSIGVLGNTQPYVYYDKDILTGYNIDLMSEILDRIGVTYEFKDLPFSRILEELKNGSLDIGMDLYKNPDREQFALYPDLPFAGYPTVIFKRTDTDLEFTGNLDELKPYTIGYVRDYSLGPLDPFIEGDVYNLMATDSPEQNMENLVNGRVDIILDIKSTGESIIDNMALSGVAAIEPALYYDFSYIVFSKAQGLENLVEEYNRIIIEMFEDGTIEALSNKYNIPYLDLEVLEQ